MVESAAALTDAGWQVLHIAGAASDVDRPRSARLPHGRVLPTAWTSPSAIADVAVSRAGAATVSELAALGIPAVYVPYPVGNGEQRFNAADVVGAGGGILVDDADFTPAWVQRELVPLLGDRDRVARMAAAAASVGHRDGTDRMVALVDAALGGGAGDAAQGA